MNLPTENDHVTARISVLNECALIRHNDRFFSLCGGTLRDLGGPPNLGYYAEDSWREIVAPLADVRRELDTALALHETMLCVLYLLDASMSDETRAACAASLEFQLADAARAQATAAQLAQLARLPVHDVAGARALGLGPLSTRLLDSWGA